MACWWIGRGGISCGESSRSDMDILISPGGHLRHIYNDNLDLADIGRTTISRASHVEPDADGQWIVDLAPVNGPMLGPFVKRAEALGAEIAWLEVNGLPVPVYPFESVNRSPGRGFKAAAGVQLNQFLSPVDGTDARNAFAILTPIGTSNDDERIIGREN